MSAPKKFAIYEKRHASGNVGFRVDLGLVNGKRSFKSFPTREAAEKFRKGHLEKAAAKNPLLLSDIDAALRHEILLALERLREYRATITQAVDYFIKHSRPAKAEATIGEVADEFQRVKKGAGLSDKYLDTARASFFVPFRDAFNNCNVTEVTSAAVEKYVYKNKAWSATTRNTVIRHLSVLFNFAIERGHATQNPLRTIQKPKRAVSNAKDKVLATADVIKLLNYAFNNDYRPECAALVLILFCGVRVDEVDKVHWEHVKLDEEPPVVVLDETKANRRRVNQLPDNAVDWLKELRVKGKITPSNYVGRMRYLRRLSKVPYKQNSARISFASYHVAMHEDASKTSVMLGHQSPALLWNTYRALVSKSAAKEYWKIVPGYDGEGTPQERLSHDEIRKLRGKRIAGVLDRDTKAQES